MITVIGIRFRRAGKVYYFAPEDNVLYNQGQHAIVETARGVEYGEVVIPNKEVAEEEVVQPLKKVIRLATEEDDERYKQNKVKEKEAFFICKEKIIKHQLDMKLIDVEYTFDNNKVLFYFTSYERVDFRELVKELASIFKTRIELRQIGVRDETKMCGGIGICGRSLCCNSFLGDFQPVSIKMAKEQSLSLNPIKISGICGRLMCCLKYEQDCYVEIRGRLPVVGDIVITPDGKGEVLSVNVLREQIKVAVQKKDKDEKEAIMYHSTDLKIVKKKKCGGCHNGGEIDKEYEGFDFSTLE
ncbi:stage 0 sporulation family protein [Cellulosilyticum sp. ST5]|uniref:PSP1 domain protein n=1 Tax=Cellulosilyticum lentocellum (strain ATCC 49066 / DSM 5427 / NCIMB 11756 / RHM5) TaxID=642492 RepID=F2JSJ6_CELLD|nr:MULTISPECIES: stage 0 sporulation family protein [Cellulosilyticum]ADZ81776.1 PSP1 domain protein [Cellulosilyticum lentocellum DSM 5427]